MTTLENLRLFVIESLPDSIERRDLISLIESEISNANGEGNSFIARFSLAEAREWMEFKNFKHTSIEAEKKFIPTAGTIELTGNLHPEIKRLGLKTGDTVNAVFHKNRSAQFEFRQNGFTVLCSVWPDNYRLITEVKND
jgi:hypothetical protein